MKKATKLRTISEKQVKVKNLFFCCYNVSVSKIKGKISYCKSVHKVIHISKHTHTTK